MFVRNTLAAALAALAIAMPARAAPIVVDIAVSGSSVLDSSVPRGQAAIGPVRGTARLSFEVASVQWSPGGNVSLTDFFPRTSSFSFISPVSAFLSPNPAVAVAGSVPSTLGLTAAVGEGVFGFSSAFDVTVTTIATRTEDTIVHNLILTGFLDGAIGGVRADRVLDAAGLVALFRGYQAAGRPLVFIEAFTQFDGLIAPRFVSFTDSAARIVSVTFGDEPPAAVPAPAGMAVLLLGLAGMVAVRRRAASVPA